MAPVKRRLATTSVTANRAASRLPLVPYFHFTSCTNLPVVLYCSANQHRNPKQCPVLVQPPARNRPWACVTVPLACSCTLLPVSQ